MTECVRTEEGDKLVFRRQGRECVRKKSEIQEEWVVYTICTWGRRGIREEGVICLKKQLYAWRRKDMLEEGMIYLTKEWYTWRRSYMLEEGMIYLTKELYAWGWNYILDEGAVCVRKWSHARGLAWGRKEPFAWGIRGMREKGVGWERKRWEEGGKKEMLIKRTTREEVIWCRRTKRDLGYIGVKHGRRELEEEGGKCMHWEIVGKGRRRQEGGGRIGMWKE